MMEDSIELSPSDQGEVLPSDQGEVQEINFFVSPQNSNHKVLFHTASQ